MYGNNCSSCGNERTGNHQYNCKPCMAERSKSWRKANPEKAKQAVSKYQKSNRERLRLNRRRDLLKRLYNITIYQYDELLAAQSGKCAICSTTTPDGPGKKFFVDHCHDTNRVRGLLCCRCNFVLGHARDRTDVLRNAISYLEKTDGG